MKEKRKRQKDCCLATDTVDLLNANNGLYSLLEFRAISQQNKIYYCELTLTHFQNPKHILRLRLGRCRLEWSFD